MSALDSRSLVSSGALPIAWLSISLKVQVPIARSPIVAAVPSGVVGSAVVGDRHD
jgi:hypothetical protein